jgi:hypothetical protein
MNSNGAEDEFPARPFLPTSAVDIPDGQTLSAVRDALTVMEPDRETAEKLLAVIDGGVEARRGEPHPRHATGPGTSALAASGLRSVCRHAKATG